MKGIWVPPHGLGPDDTQLLRAEADADIDVIVDARHPGAPLVIAFGFADWHAPARFDFARRLRKLERDDGRPLNLLLVRDTANLWYQHGVSSLGPDVRSMAAGLWRLIALLRPRSVGTIGQSMGGYAAILFGALLNVNAVLAFGPLSYLRSDWARRDGDTRWLAMMEMLDRFPSAERHDDLPALLAASTRIPSLRILFGTGPERDGTPNHDDLHARRYAAHPAAGVVTISEAGHAVVEWLINRGRIDDTLRRHLLDPLAESGLEWAAPALPPAADEGASSKPWDDGWRGWIAENLALGATGEGLLPTLVEQGFHPGEARREIYKAARSPYLVPLSRLLERSRSRSS